MGVYVPNWSIPESCHDCPFARVVYCSILRQGDYVGGFHTRNMRNPKCPLVVIETPHGRLIDKNEITAFLQLERNGHNVESLDEYPSILEAEE